MCRCEPASLQPGLPNPPANRSFTSDIGRGEQQLAVRRKRQDVRSTDTSAPLRQLAARRPLGRAHLPSFSQRKGAFQTVTGEAHTRTSSGAEVLPLGQEFGAGGRTTERLLKRWCVQISVLDCAIPAARVRAPCVSRGGVFAMNDNRLSVPCPRAFASRSKATRGSSDIPRDLNRRARWRSVVLPIVANAYAEHRHSQQLPRLLSESSISTPPSAASPFFCSSGRTIFAGERCLGRLTLRLFALCHGTTCISSLLSNCSWQNGANP